MTLSLPRSLRFAVASFSLVLSACPTGGPGSDDDDDVSGLDEIPVGTFVITEIQANPLANRPEFIEVFNTADEALSLRGCSVGTGGTSANEFIVVGDAEVAAQGYGILASGAFLGNQEGEIPATAVWTGVAINQADDTETITLACPDGSGGRTVTDVVGFDPNAGWTPRRGHTWQLIGAPSAAANDAPVNWCEAPTQANTTFATIDGFPAYGTPGSPTICEEQGGASPIEGQVVITEIAVDPCGTTKEWFELYNPGTEPLDVRRCQIVDVPVDGSTKPAVHTIEADRGATLLPPGGYLVLNASTLSDPSTAITGDGLVQADYPYADSVSFKNDGNQYLSLECPVDGGTTVIVDRVVFNWVDQGQGLKGRTLSLDPALSTEEENDELGAWCLGSGVPYAADVECSDLGSPGVANPACPVPDPFPGVGDLVFTEVMALSATDVGTNEEWLEVKNVGGSTFGLVGCKLAVDDGSEVAEHTIASALGLSIQAGEYLVLAKSSATDSLTTCALPHGYLYGTNLNLSNSDPETLRLSCPSGAATSVVVDEVPYQFVTADPRGVAWQLDPTLETTALNDAATAWCFDDPASAGFPWSCTVGEDTNYGSPGAASTCP